MDSIITRKITRVPASSQVHDTDRNKRKRFLVFILILITVLKLLSFYIDRVYLKDHQILGRLQSVAGVTNEPENTLDLLVLGDSETYTSLSPMVLWEKNGTTGYIIGQGGQQILEAYRNLQTALATQKPKMVLVETNMFFRSPKSITYSVNVFDEAVKDQFSVFTYHNLWKQVADPSVETGSDYFKGFKIRQAIQPYTGNTDYMNTNRKNARISGQVQTYMQKIAGLCKENGITLAFYSAPSPSNCSMGRHQAAAELADTLGVKYLDLNLIGQELEINWRTDTADKGDHLNISGAVKVSDYMAVWLKTFSLPDHRGDGRYKSWETLAETYKARMAALDIESGK